MGRHERDGADSLPEVCFFNLHRSQQGCRTCIRTIKRQSHEAKLFLLTYSQHLHAAETVYICPFKVGLSNTKKGEQMQRFVVALVTPNCCSSEPAVKQEGQCVISGVDVLLQSQRDFIMASQV